MSPHPLPSPLTLSLCRLAWCPASVRKMTRPRESRKTWALSGLCLPSQHGCPVPLLPQRGLAQEVPSEHWRTGRGRPGWLGQCHSPPILTWRGLGTGVQACVPVCEPHPRERFPLASRHSLSLLPQLEESKGPGPQPKGEESDYSLQLRSR